MGIRQLSCVTEQQLSIMSKHDTKPKEEIKEILTIEKSKTQKENS